MAEGDVQPCAPEGAGGQGWLCCWPDLALSSGDHSHKCTRFSLTNFATRIEMKRKYNPPNVQIILHWETTSQRSVPRKLYLKEAEVEGLSEKRQNLQNASKINRIKPRTCLAGTKDCHNQSLS